MTRTELKTQAETYRKLAEKATSEGMRTVYLKKARNYYAEMEMTGMVRWCERHLS